MKIQGDHGGQVHVEHVGGADGTGVGELLHEVLQPDAVLGVEVPKVPYLDLPQAGFHFP